MEKQYIETKLIIKTFFIIISITSFWNGFLIFLAGYQAVKNNANWSLIWMMFIFLFITIAWSFFYTLVFIGLPETFKRLVFRSVGFYVSILTGASFFHLTTFGELIGLPSVMILFETNKNEAFEFLSTTIDLIKLIITFSITITVYIAVEYSLKLLFEIKITLYNNSNG